MNISILVSKLNRVNDMVDNIDLMFILLKLKFG